MERIGRTVALPGAFISTIGAALVIFGAALPAWYAYNRTHADDGGIDARITIVGGELRPTMLLLPAMPNGKRFAIADHKVTFSQYLRVMGEVSSDAVRLFGGQSQTCPILMTAATYDDPILCMTPLEAADYANRLTKIENDSVRSVSGGALLTPCYSGEKLRLADLNCTGYRLPTIEEWSYAAKATGQTKDAGANPSVAGLGPADASLCSSSDWFIYGMCESKEIAVAIAAQGEPAATAVGDPGGAASPLGSPNERRAIGFRLVRMPSGGNLL